MDGMEITQFTYFQQAGGIDLDPISVELAYGLERLAMYLQGVRRAQDMQWSDGRTLGDVRCCRTSARCRPTTTSWPTSTMLRPPFRRLRGRGAAAASRPGCRCPPTTTCSSARTRSTCSIPAAAIAVTDRAAYILRMRRLAQAVARAYLEIEEAPVPDLLVEIGCEELPAAPCRQAEAQLPGLLADALDKAGIASAERRRPRRAAAARGRRARPSRRAGRRAPRGARPARRRTRAGARRVRAQARARRRRARASATASCGRSPRGRRRRSPTSCPAVVAASVAAAPASRSRCAGTAAASRARSAGWW